MGFTKYNPNPQGKEVGDCTVRAVAAALDGDWEKIYIELCLQGLCMADMPSSNAVWGEYLKSKGFKRHHIPDTCPECYTVADFSRDHRKGRYVVGTGTHVITVIDGNYLDAYDSGKMNPLFYWEKESVKK